MDGSSTPRCTKRTVWFPPWHGSSNSGSRTSPRTPLASPFATPCSSVSFTSCTLEPRASITSPTTARIRTRNQHLSLYQEHLPPEVDTTRDAKQRKVVIDTQRPPLSPKVVSTHLAAMLKLDQEQLTKFRPSRPLRANLTEERPVIAFLLELALTIGDDHEAMHAFRLLANNSVWNLVGVTMRREGLRRSPQMQTLRDQLEALRTGGNEG